MLLNDTLKIATIALPNFAAAGALGTAIATVDIASTFVIKQTTANITLTIPNPTDALAGDRLVIGSDSTSSADFVVAGVLLVPGEYATWIWSGVAWLFGDGGRNSGMKVIAATIAVGSNLIVHNLAMPTGSFSDVIFQAFNAIGNKIEFKRNFAGDTANAIAVSSPIAIATATTFYITPLK